MEWVRVSLFVVALAQWACGRESIQSVTTPHLAKRNIVSRTPSGDLQTDKGVKEELFPGRVLYHVQEDPRAARSSSLPYGDSPSGDLEADSYLISDSEKPFQGPFEDDDAQSRAYGDRPLPSTLSQEWTSGGFGDNAALPSDEEDNSNDLPDMAPLNAVERLVLQKRLQMKGMGLLGSPRGKPSSLVGFSKSPSKGLVLSIDLGIKALRDAILHAKVQQKNRQHKMQAQKNMRLLHNIGKRRIQSTSLDRP